MVSAEGQPKPTVLGRCELSGAERAGQGGQGRAGHEEVTTDRQAKGRGQVDRAGRSDWAERGREEREEAEWQRREARVARA